MAQAAYVDKDMILTSNTVPVNPTASPDSVHEGDVEARSSSRAANRLNRGLKARHISMIALGGSIGTGLIIGT